MLAPLAALALVGVLQDALVLGPKWEEAGRVRLEPLVARLTCDGGPTCAFEVRVRATKADDRPAAGAFYAGGARELGVIVDGASARAPAPLPPALERFEASRWSSPYARAGEADLEAPIAFVVEGPSGSTHEIVLAGRVEVRAIERAIPDKIASSSALEARHLLLGAPPDERGAGLLVVAPVEGLGPTRTPGGLRRQGTLVATAPPAWRIEGRGDRACPAAVTGVLACGEPDEIVREEGGARTLTREATALGRHLVLGARAFAPPDGALVVHGGPLVGAGVAFGDRGGFRARLGWEVGLGGSGAVLGALSVDSDLSRTVTVAPTVSLATRASAIRPSFGAGLGVPVLLAPDVATGARLQADVKYFGVGLVGWVDLLLLGAPFAATGGVLGEVSF